MALDTTIIQSKVEGRFGAKVSNFRMEQDILTFETNRYGIKELIRFLHEDEALNFNFLTDICGVHYPGNAKEAEFAVVYLLHNWVDNTRVRVKIFVSRDDIAVDTITDIFSAANWMERETFDFYGIIFTGHPNLKRILNDEGMTSHPMRKEYPMEDPERTDKDDRFFGRTRNNDQQKQY